MKIRLALMLLTVAVFSGIAGYGCTASFGYVPLPRQDIFRTICIVSGAASVFFQLISLRSPL